MPTKVQSNRILIKTIQELRKRDDIRIAQFQELGRKMKAENESLLAQVKELKSSQMSQRNQVVSNYIQSIADINRGVAELMKETGGGLCR